MIRRTYDGWGYSPLDQITPANVGQLRPAWVFSTGVGSGHEAAPVVVNGVMFLSTPEHRVVAIDAEDRRAAVALHQGGRGADHRAASDHARHRPLRRQGVLRRQRRRARRARCPHRAAGVVREGGREQGRLLHDAGAAGGRRQGDGRCVGRRARRARLRGRVRRRDRQAAVAHLHRAGARRARQRDLAQGRPVEERRRAGVGHRQLRSGHQPDVLGHRQRRPVDGRPAARRQPLHRVHGGPRRRDRRRSRATSSTTPTTRGTGTRCRRRSSWTSSATAAP